MGLRYALRYAPFFRELHQGHEPADVWALPMVDEWIMMANLTEYDIHRAFDVDI